MDWDDLRFVLAVRRAGSALKAAQALGVNQTTVTRRIAGIEARLGAELFDRRASGYGATPHGEQVADAAEQVEMIIDQLANQLAAERRSLTGIVRLTTSETLANRLVAPCLGAFRKAHPGIVIQLITDDRRLDVARGEADIALRAGSRPTGGGIVMRRMPDTPWAAYCGTGYAQDNGRPCSIDELAGHAVIGMEGPMARIGAVQWLEERAPPSSVRFHSNSLTNLVSNLRAGLGIAMLPCLVGEEEPDLVRCFRPPADHDAEMWLIVREELRSTPHVRAFADFLAAHVAQSVATHLGAIQDEVSGTGPAQPG